MIVSESKNREVQYCGSLSPEIILLCYEVKKAWDQWRTEAEFLFARFYQEDVKRCFQPLC